jgi:hypothetical protein
VKDGQLTIAGRSLLDQPSAAPAQTAPPP